MFGLGFPELLIILVIILVIFGAGKLPQVGEALGKGLNKFRGAMDEKDSDKTTDHASHIVEPQGVSVVEEKEKNEEEVK